MLFRWLLISLSLVVMPAKGAERWVSLNQCVDQLLMRWAPQQLNGVTYLSRTATEWPSHNGSLESILSLRPDRVIATEFTDPRLVERLQQYTKVTVLPQPQTWQDYQQWLQQLAELGLQAQVDQHAKQTRNALARLATEPQQVVLVMPNQWSWGENTWADTLINQLAWQNQSAELGQGLVALDLEQLIQWQPDTVVLEGFSEQSFALANSWQQHPLLRDWLKRQKVVRISADTAACPVVNIQQYLAVLGGETR